MKKQTVRILITAMSLSFLCSCSDFKYEIGKSQDYKNERVLTMNNENVNNQQKLELGIIKGQVLNENGKPIEGAKVYAFSANKSLEGRIKYFISDEKGLFIISNVKNGKYGIHAFNDDQGYSDTMFAFYVNPKNSIPIVEVKGGQIIENIIIKLEEKTYLLSGKVIDEKSKDLIKDVSQIELCREDNPDACTFVSPNLESGEFQIKVPSTKIKITVKSKSYEEKVVTEDFSNGEKNLSLEMNLIK